MGSTIYDGMRRTKGWMLMYTHHVTQGDGSKLAASRAGVSVHTVKQKYDSDPTFAAEVEKAERDGLLSAKGRRRAAIAS